MLRYIRRSLEEVQYAVTSCDNGADALDYAANDHWNLLVVDRLLPGGVDGLAIVRNFRRLGRTAPVVVVSALTDTDARIEGLQAGADDYLSKPFAIAELLARIEALQRRHGRKYASHCLQVADLTLDTRAFSVNRGAVPIALQPRQFNLLAYLMRHEGQVITRTMLLEAVWGCNCASSQDAVDVQISRLRRKVDDGFSPALIHTIRGVGYLLGERA